MVKKKLQFVFSFPQIIQPYLRESILLQHCSHADTSRHQTHRKMSSKGTKQKERRQEYGDKTKNGETRWGRKRERLQRCMSECVCSKRVKHCRENEGGCVFSISTHHTGTSAEAFGETGFYWGKAPLSTVSPISLVRETLALTNTRRKTKNHRCRRKGRGRTKKAHKYKRVTHCSHLEHKSSLNCLRINFFFNEIKPVLMRLFSVPETGKGISGAVRIHFYHHLPFFSSNSLLEPFSCSAFEGLHFPTG